MLRRFRSCCCCCCCCCCCFRRRSASTDSMFSFMLRRRWSCRAAASTMWPAKEPGDDCDGDVITSPPLPEMGLVLGFRGGGGPPYGRRRDALVFLLLVLALLSLFDADTDTDADAAAAAAAAVSVEAATTEAGFSARRVGDTVPFPLARVVRNEPRSQPTAAETCCDNDPSASLLAPPVTVVAPIRRTTLPVANPLLLLLLLLVPCLADEAIVSSVCPSRRPSTVTPRPASNHAFPRQSSHHRQRTHPVWACLLYTSPSPRDRG